MRVSENWPERGHRGGCACGRCQRERRMVERLARESLSTALRHAQDSSEAWYGFEAQTQGGDLNLGGTSLGRWRGWSPASVDLLAIYIAANDADQRIPEVYRQRNSARLLYRIYEQNKQIPLYIGAAFRASIRGRIKDHLQPILTPQGAVNAAAPRVAALRSIPHLPNTPAFQRFFESRFGEVGKFQWFVIQRNGIAGLVVKNGTADPPAGKSAQTLGPKWLHVFELALQVAETPHSYVRTSRTFEEDEADDWL
jgi:hypothetical protein